MISWESFCIAVGGIPPSREDVLDVLKRGEEDAQNKIVAFEWEEGLTTTSSFGTVWMTGPCPATNIYSPFVLVPMQKMKRIRELDFIDLPPQKRPVSAVLVDPESSESFSDRKSCDTESDIDEHADLF